MTVESDREELQKFVDDICDRFENALKSKRNHPQIS